MYYSVPIKNKATLFFSSKRKLLFGISKKYLDFIIGKYLDGKLTEKSQYYQILGGLFEEQQRAGPIKKSDLSSKKRFTLILGTKKIEISDSFISVDFDKFLSQGRVNRSIIIGPIFDPLFLNKIEFNKQKLDGSLCILFDLEKFYFFRITNNLCLRCLLLRRAANLSNMIETLLTEDYIYKMGENKILKQYDSQITHLINFGHRIKDNNIYILKMDGGKIHKSALIPFSLCPDCNGKAHGKYFFKKDLLDPELGLLRFLPNQEKRIGNKKIYLSFSRLSQIVPIIHTNIFEVPKNPDTLNNFFLKKESFDDFSIFRPVICGGGHLFLKRQLLKKKHWERRWKDIALLCWTEKEWRSEHSGLLPKTKPWAHKTGSYMTILNTTQPIFHI